MTERPIIFDRGPADRPKTSLLDDLIDLDGKLLSMLARRCRMMQRAAKGRQVLDRDIEKRLWAAFEQAARTQSLDQRLARQLFAMLGSFGLEAPEGRRSADKPFTLVPRSEPADIDIAGPRSLALTRMLAVLAAATGQGLRLSGVVLNDPLIELVKALNQAGARLSWTDDGLESKSAPGAKPGKLGQVQPETEEPLLRFEETLIFCGDDPFTLFALMALALREPGRAKFAGGAELKMLDLRCLEAPLLHLGARLAGMNPRSRGLPARLESGGRMASRIELLPDTPPLFAQAVALAAWSYPGGLRLALCADAAAAQAQARALDEALEALALCRVPVSRQGDEYIISAAQPRLPQEPDLPLDPALSAYLLALPALAGGQARLSGRLALPAEVQADLKALGLPLEISQEGGRPAATLRHDHMTAGASLAMGRRAEFLPLALALAVKAATSPLSAGPVTVALPPETPGGEPHRALALELLDRLGVGFSEGGEDAVTVLPAAPGEVARLGWDGVWTSPGPHMTLGLALLSFAAPGIAIDNPGGLTALWPRFWACYNALPIVRDQQPAPKEPEKHDAKPKRRRVRV